MNTQIAFETPYEAGNGNQTTTWSDCIAFYERLAERYPHCLSFVKAAESDAGVPLYLGIVSADGVFDREQIQSAGRTIFFNNNGIHPGEPEGIDACMALVRDLCTQPDRLAALGSTVYLFIPIYNVEGALNRSDRTRCNQDGPEQFGFRGNSLHLDLNRDFIKCDSANARWFNQVLSAWRPAVMIDTHTSNGADYPYTMTLIHTQADKLGGALGDFLRKQFLPAFYERMDKAGWPTCPYVNPVQDSPDQGIAEFLEVPRFSTGYAALHHVIGFMPETHMLKPFADRYASMHALLEAGLALTIEHGAHLRELREQTIAEDSTRTQWPVSWEIDMTRPERLHFRGYAAKRKPSRIGNYDRLWYDRDEPWEADIDYFCHARVQHSVHAPQAYVVPAQWSAVIERLRCNGVQMTRIDTARTLEVESYRFEHVSTRALPYEGHNFHDHIEYATQHETVEVHPGDMYIDLAQARARYIVETLEPMAHDSFMRWGFFDAVLEKKEHYSDYVFEDMAEQLLETEPALRAQFDAWKQANPAQLSEQAAVLDFIFEHCARYREPEWRRYPVLRVVRQ